MFCLPYDQVMWAKIKARGAPYSADRSFSANRFGFKCCCVEMSSASATAAAAAAGELCENIDMPACDMAFSCLG